MSLSDPDYAVGGELITNTSAHTGRFKRVDFYEATEISAMSSNLTATRLQEKQFRLEQLSMDLSRVLLWQVVLVSPIESNGISRIIKSIYQ